MKPKSEPSRAETRHEDRRALARVKIVVKQDEKQNRIDATVPIDPEIIAQRAVRRRHQRGVCSCQMCRNPRTSKVQKGKDKTTRQEKRADSKTEQ